MKTSSGQESDSPKHPALACEPASDSYDGHSPAICPFLSTHAGKLVHLLQEGGTVTIEEASKALDASKEEVASAIEEAEAFAQFRWNPERSAFRADGEETGEPFPQMLRRLSHSFMVFIGMKMPTIAVGFTTKFLIGHWLAASMFGLYSVVMNAAVALSFLIPLGFPTALSRMIPLMLKTGHPAQVRGVIQVSLLTAAIGSVVLFVLGSPFIFAFGHAPHFRTAWFAGFLLAALMAFSSVLSACFRAHKNWKLSLAAGLTVPAIYLALVGVIFQFNEQFIRHAPTHLLLAMCAIMLVSIAGQLVGMRTAFPKEVWEQKAVRHWKKWIWSAAPMLVVSSMVVILLRMDLFAIAIVRGHREAGIYAAVLAIVAVLSQVVRAANSVVMPEIAPLYAKGRSRSLQTLSNVQTILSFWPSLVASILMVLFGKSLLHLWHPEFVEGYPALVILLLGMMVRASNGNPGYLLLMCGKSTTLVRIYLVIVAMDLLVLAILVPLYGITGAAIGTFISLTASRLILRRQVLNDLGVETGLPALWNAAKHQQSLPSRQ